MHDQSIVVFDLDGTLVRCNTFHKFINFLLFDKRSNLKLSYKVLIAYYSMLRLFRLISHKHLKIKVIRFSNRLNGSSIQRFVDDFIQVEISAVCLSEIQSWKKKGALLVLATAAPMSYSVYIAEKFGFDKVLASYIDGSDRLFECFKQKKAECVAKYAAGRSILAVYSDHDDDIPLFDLAESSVLVNPIDKNVCLLLGKDERNTIRYIYDS